MQCKRQFRVGKEGIVSMNRKKKVKDKKKYIFRPYVTRNGVTYWAKNYGIKAFPIQIDE